MSFNNDSIKNSILKFQIGDALWSNIFKPDQRENESITATLRRVPLFRDMKRTQLREFEKIIHRRKYKAGETIFYEGEPGVGMYIVQDGLVRICRESLNHTEELAQLKHGEFFGELALLDESPRSAKAIAAEDSHILGLFRPDLLGLIERKPRLGNRFLLQLACMIGERLKRTNEELQAVWNRLDDSKVIT